MTYYVDKFSTKSFEDLQARALLMSCKGVKLNHLVLRHKKCVYWANNESITTTQGSYLTSIRSNYLSLRQGNHWVIQPYYPYQFCRQFGHPQDVLGGLPEVFHIGTLQAMYKHWKSCTRLGTHSKVTILDYHSLEEFSITKAYADWWIEVCNLEKNTLTTAYIEPPHDSSQKIPLKSWESRTRKIDPSVSTKRNVGDNIEGNFDNLPNDSGVSSKRLMDGH